nr:MAG TPA: hypothetical protein [Caudoviricetes sp.]
MSRRNFDIFEIILLTYRNFYIIIMLKGGTE